MMNSQELTNLWQLDQVGDFRLTEAIRPSSLLPVLPREGFRLRKHLCSFGGLEVPALSAAVSREHLFDVFLDLLDPLGDEVNVVLETSHETDEISHTDLYRWLIDLPVLKSYFCEYEEMLLNDGCAGVAVIAQERAMEVQFDEHKLLTVYAFDLQPFVDVLLQHGMQRDDQLKLISEGDHLHSTEPRHRNAFERLCCCLGVDEAVGSVRG